MVQSIKSDEQGRLLSKGYNWLKWEITLCPGSVRWLEAGWGVRHDTWGNWSPLWHKEGAGAPTGWCSTNCTMHTLLRKHDMLFTGVPRKCEMSALLPECPLTKWKRSHRAVQYKTDHTACTLLTTHESNVLHTLCTQEWNQIPNTKCISRRIEQYAKHSWSQ